MQKKITQFAKKSAATQGKAAQNQQQQQKQKRSQKPRVYNTPTHRGQTFATRSEYKAKISELVQGLSIGEASLAMAMLDPGHSSAALNNATPFPDAQLKNVLVVPMQTDFDITIPAGGSLNLMLLNHPIIACVYKTSFFPNQWFAIPHTITKSSANPGTWMTDNRLDLCRCLGKSMTATNITPALNKGGICYANAFSVSPALTNIMPGSNATDLTNNVAYYGLPSTLPQMLNRPGYYTGSPEGAYIQARHIDWLPHRVAVGGEINPFTAAPATGTKSNGLAIPDASVPDNGAITQDMLVKYGNPLTGYIEGSIVNLPCIEDGTDTCGVFITGSVAVQTYHVKVHALYEFTPEAMASSLIKGICAEPNERLVSKIRIALDALDRFYPENYNSAGKVWNWFKSFYNNGASSVIKPVLGNLPMGATASALLDAFMKTNVPQEDDIEYYN